MNRIIFLLIAGSMLPLITKAQINDLQNQTAVFEDGTKISYKIMDNTGDSQFENTIAVFSQMDDKSTSSSNLMYQRYNSEKFIAAAELSVVPQHGLGGIAIGGNYFLASFEKNYELPISLRVVSTGTTETKYVIKTPCIKNKHVGVSFEAGYRNYNVEGSSISVQQRNYVFTSLSCASVAVGFGYLATKSAIIKVDDKGYMGGSRLFQFTADLMVYPGVKFAYTTNDSVSAATPLTLHDVSSGAIGFRILIQGQNSMKFHKKDDLPSNNFGFFYKLGIMKAPHAPLEGFGLSIAGTSVIGSLGLFVNF